MVNVADFVLWGTPVLMAYVLYPQQNRCSDVGDGGVIAAHLQETVE